MLASFETDRNALDDVPFLEGVAKQIALAVENMRAYEEIARLRARLEPRPSTAPRERGTRTLEEVEREHILAVLEGTSWRVSGEGGAAGLLGMKPTTLEARIKKLGITRPR